MSMSISESSILTSDYERIKNEWFDIIHLKSNIKFMLFKVSEKKIDLIKIINRLLENKDYFESSIQENFSKLKNTLDTNNLIEELCDEPEILMEPNLDTESDIKCRKITKLFNQFKSKTNDINLITMQIDNFHFELIFKKDILDERMDDFIKNNTKTNTDANTDANTNDLIKSICKMKKYMGIFIFPDDDDNVIEIEAESDDYTEEYVENLLIGQ